MNRCSIRFKGDILGDLVTRLRGKLDSPLALKLNPPQIILFDRHELC